METNLQPLGHAAVFELLGDTLDATCAEELKGQLRGLAAAHRHLVLDLGRVRYIDSAGCGALLAGLNRFREAGGEMRLCEVRPTVRSVLDIARLTRVLPVDETRQESLAAFGP